MSIRIGAMRHRQCGCISQYAMWQPNILTWATVLLCERHGYYEHPEDITR